jgi:glucose-1-phosphate adenylyltransferase
MMGADYYESDLSESPANGHPRIGIGQGTHIENAIIDKNARIGDNVVISPAGKAADYDGEGFYIRDGIVVVPKNSVIPSGTWL